MTSGLLAPSAQRTSVVTLDLSEVRSLSCLATGVLVSFRRGVVRAGGRVRVAEELQSAGKEALARADLLKLFKTTAGAAARDRQAGQTTPALEQAGDGTAVLTTSQKGSNTMQRYPNIRDIERLHGIAWLDLAELEPQLAELLHQARHAAAGCRRLSAVPELFSAIRNRLPELVGLTARSCRHPVLGSFGAYEVAYWKLYGAVAALLPPGAESAPPMTQSPVAA
jgi:hypothetical protein